MGPMDEQGRHVVEAPEENGWDERVFGAKRQAKIQVRIARVRRSRAAALIVVGMLVIAAGLNLSAVRERSREAFRAAASTPSPGEMAAPPFATISGTGIALHLPAKLENVIGLGYHQAYNLRSAGLNSTMALRENATTAAITRSSRPGAPVAFVMASRGRGSARTSSVDIAVNDGTVIRSPVSGRVGKVTPYILYGRYDDVRIEIEPDGRKDILVAIVHLDQPLVAAGRRVEAGLTPLARPRRLPVNSQIDQYLGKVTEHIHIQINPVEDDEETGDANTR